MSMLSPGSVSALQDACLVCRYPSWTEARGANDDEESEILCHSFNDLQVSSANGCLGCLVLVRAWEYGTPALEDRKEEQIAFNRSAGHLYLHLFKKPRGVLNIDIFTIDTTPPFKHIRPAALISLTTNLSENLGMILQWLRTCEQQHNTCSVSNTQVPPRLLDLETRSPDSIRLVELNQPDITSDKEENARFDFRYACLSHCWGKTRCKHVTTTSNFDANVRGIPVSDLPPTFQDAITISRALSIRYLWIDSLCIVQDDRVDWKIHVNEMAQIYRNAYITLAAGASGSDDSGFFQQASAPFSSPSSFMLNDGHMERKVYIRRCLPHPDEDWPSGEQMPLMARGWVFQERLLSRRFLCFAANEVLWECLEDVACSCSTTPDSFKHRSQADKPTLLNCPPIKFEFAKISQLPREKLWILWRQLVAQYTVRDLTFIHDKLPALAGLARYFQAADAGKYIQGMWVESLEKDILWQSYGYSDEQSRPRKASSWSWVSAADGGIEWNENITGSYSRVIRVVDQDCDDDQMNSSSRRLLSLCAPLTHISLHEKEASNGMECYKGYRCCSVNKWTVTYDGPTTSDTIPTMPNSDLASEDTLSESSTRVMSAITCLDDTDPAEFLKNAGNLWTDYKFWSDEENLWQILDNVFFVELGIEADLTIYGYVPLESCWTAGLILRSCNRELDGTAIYERLGWLRFDTKKPRADWKHVGAITNILIE